MNEGMTYSILWLKEPLHKEMTGELTQLFTITYSEHKPVFPTNRTRQPPHTVGCNCLARDYSSLHTTRTTTID